VSRDADRDEAEVEALRGELELCDDLVARRSVEIWLGGEPTFTRADSVDAAWLHAALGDDKLARAHALAAGFARRVGGAVRRVVGRHYPDEPEPRFMWGVPWSADAAGAAGAAATEIAAVDAPAVPLGLPTERWLTVTPDPGVVEVNMAPSADVVDFAGQSAAIWRAAHAAGLTAARYRWNGDATDSGGGGQLTFGGATDATSPFVRYPHLVPALVRYVNDHPALSFWFAGECVGSASQAPRPDQGVRERWSELAVALDWLDRLSDRGELGVDTVWRALAPLLVDASGNSHRAELNIEKLANPHLAAHGPRHGRMGVVELRALRMPERPIMAAAAAALYRAILARLVVDDYRGAPIDWHDDLHDRFALPAALELDLQHVLGDLDDHGLGLPAGLRAQLAAWRPPGITCRLGDATLELRRAVEFWPLLGDVASQERTTARWVDASTERWQLRLDAPDPDAAVVAVAGKRVRLQRLPGASAGTAASARVVGVRRRVFAPAPGLHPGMPPLDPLVVEWAIGGRRQRIELWGWRPAGGAYDTLPIDATDAAARRAERVVVVTDAGGLDAPGWWPQPQPFTVDTRGSGG
jgi:uncharacterized protein (DUF2126 family)